jgi:uncharacterized protein with HEPN domain
MSRHDPQYRFLHMRTYGHEALALASGRSRTDLDTDRLFELAITRLLELIGEAASQVPLEERNRHPQVQWSGVIRFRNRLIHGYDVIDPDIVWAVIQKDLPTLVEQLDRIIATDSTPTEDQT